MVKYIAKHKLGDHLYIAELEQDGNKVFAIVHESKDGKIKRVCVFGKEANK